jgi:MFS transporter, ACS family, tartrate transporter
VRFDMRRDMPSGRPIAAPDAARLQLRLTLRLIAPLALVSLVNSLDRVNVSYAALRMSADIGLGPQEYGFGVSLFFVGYVLFQLPHMWLLGRIGMRAWLAGAIFCWGCIGIAMAFQRSVAEFYALRFLLGVAEAGLGPGVTFYVSQWMPSRLRAWAVAGAMVAVPVSFVACGPLSGWLIEAHNPLGWPGWRWMFLMQGLPNLVLALGALGFFVDRLSEARWLSEDEKRWLAAELDRDRTARGAAELASVRQVAADPRVWLCSAAWFCVMTGSYGLVFWLPQVLSRVSPGRSPLGIGLISALPWAALGAGMLASAWHSDRTQERFWHVALASLAAAACLAGAFHPGPEALAFGCLVASGLALGATQGPFWAIPTGLFQGPAAAGAIAAVNMSGTAGGIVGPALIGMIRERTGSFEMSMSILAALLAATPLALAPLRNLRQSGVKQGEIRA